MDEKKKYQYDTDGWWLEFWDEAAKTMECSKCPFETECHGTGCGTNLANMFLKDYAEGKFEF